MAVERRVASIYESVDLLKGLPGPVTERYAIVKGLDRLFIWTLGDASTTDDLTVIGHSGGKAGRWIAVRAPHKGANLTDATTTIQVSGDEWRVLPASTLTTGRTLTLGTTQAKAGDRITITRLDTTANTYTVVNGGAGAGNLCVMPVSVRAFLVAQYDGTNWLARECAQMLGVV